MPFYIALALLKLGNKLIGIDEIIAFRGQSVEEIQKIGGETRVWNLGFMSLLCYDILLMFFPDDKKMLNVKNILLNEFKRQYYTISFDKSIEKTEKEYMFGKYNDLIKTITLPNTLYGMYIHYKSFLRLSGILLNIKASIKGIQAKTFFENAQ